MTDHVHDLSAFDHSHSFGDAGAQRRERALTQVTAITFAVMLLELAVGWWSGSLALLADGWHMGTHALALGGAVLAYRLSARAAQRAGYAFGGWKIEVLTAYTSGLLLIVVALLIVVDAVSTLLAPHAIAYRQAMAVALFGLLVNVLSAWLLARGATGGHGHSHGHDHGHDQGQGHRHAHHHHDQNFRAAYVHVLADAITSVLAIVALGGGLLFGLAWLDPAVALIGAAIIGQWAVTVLRGSTKALVDATADPKISNELRRRIEADGDAQVADLHVWQIGAQAWSAVVSVVADRPLPARDYRARLAGLAALRHVTVEVHACPGPAPHSRASCPPTTSPT